MARGGIEGSSDQALGLMQAGRWSDAERVYRELIGQMHVINYEYDDWLRNLVEVYKQLGRSYETAVVQLYLHYFDLAKAALRGTQQGGVDQPAMLARVAETEKRWTEAAELFAKAKLPMHAAVALERAELKDQTAPAWLSIVQAEASKLRPYEAALVHFNYGMAAAKLDVKSDEARRALIESQRKLEQVADDFETSGEYERAFDCFQILLRLGKESGQFENLAEGYVNCIRVLASDNLKFYVLQYYEDFVRLALERDEYQAAATVLQEAAAYSARVSLPYDRHYQTKAAKAWLRSAENSATVGAPPQMIENAMLAAASQFSAVGDYSSVRQVFDRLASLELGDRSKKRYAAIASKFVSMQGPALEAPGLPDYLKQQQAYADIWFADLLEWEMQGDPAAVASSIVGDLRYPNGIRRRALVILLTIAQANRSQSRTDAAVEIRLAELLGELQSYAALAPLEKLFASTEPSIRRAAVKSLRYLYFKRSFVMLRKALADDDEAVRSAAVVAIGGLHFPHAFNPLSRLFRESTDERVRRACLESIGKIASIEAAEFLIGVLRQTEGPLRDAAFTALRGIDNADALPILRQYAEVEHNQAVRDMLAQLVRRYS
jgi:hypothetical protein